MLTANLIHLYQCSLCISNIMTLIKTTTILPVSQWWNFKLMFDLYLSRLNFFSSKLLKKVPLSSSAIRLLSSNINKYFSQPPCLKPFYFPLFYLQLQNSVGDVSFLTSFLWLKWLPIAYGRKPIMLHWPMLLHLCKQCLISNFRVNKS